MALRRSSKLQVIPISHETRPTELLSRPVRVVKTHRSKHRTRPVRVSHPGMSHRRSVLAHEASLIPVDLASDISCHDAQIALHPPVVIVLWNLLLIGRFVQSVMITHLVLGILEASPGLGLRPPRRQDGGSAALGLVKEIEEATLCSCLAAGIEAVLCDFAGFARELVLVFGEEAVGVDE